MTSFTGSSTAMRRGATSFRCSRMQSSRIEKSIHESDFATPARSDEGGHARVVPALNVLSLDKLDQLSLREHDVAQVEPRELDLLRQRPLQEAGPLHAVVSGPVLGEALVEPFVERPVVLE